MIITVRLLERFPQETSEIVETGDIFMMWVKNDCSHYSCDIIYNIIYHNYYMSQLIITNDMI